uniref:Uncharacterized protein n=1 Tax=Rhizophora mucronata TaxID=61149 RepID=A0A2P2KWI2_RHIMU
MKEQRRGYRNRLRSLREKEMLSNSGLPTDTHTEHDTKTATQTDNASNLKKLCLVPFCFA